jgi:hypothetical protein
MSRITIHRHELYDQIWSKPILQVAKVYGLSDVGLAKLCQKHNVPKPPRGYWAKLEHGHQPTKAPLPDPDDDGEVLFYDPTQNSADDVVQETVAAEIKDDPQIEVAATLRGAHQLVSRANEQLAGARTDSVGLLVLPTKAALNIRVSKAQLRRALLLMDALLKALNERGYATCAGPVVTILEQPIAFSITEQVDAVRQEADETTELTGRYEFGHSRFRTKDVLSGRVCLHINYAEGYWAVGSRKSWREAKKQKLEDCLNKFVAGLVELAVRKRDHEIAEEEKRRAQAEAAKKAEEAARLRAERRQLQKDEQARLDGLLQQVSDWRTSQDIREFIQKVQEVHAAGGRPIDPDSQLGQYLSWASMQADRFDPIQKSPPSILDEVIPDEPKPYSSWSRW